MCVTSIRSKTSSGRREISSLGYARLPGADCRKPVEIFAHSSPRAKSRGLYDSSGAKTAGSTRRSSCLRKGRGSPFMALIRRYASRRDASASRRARGRGGAREKINEDLCKDIGRTCLSLFFGSRSAHATRTYCNAGHNPPYFIGTSGIALAARTGAWDTQRLCIRYRTSSLRAGLTSLIPTASRMRGRTSSFFSDKLLDRLAGVAVRRRERWLGSDRERAGFSKGEPQAAASPLWPYAHRGP